VNGALPSICAQRVGLKTICCHSQLAAITYSHNKCVVAIKILLRSIRHEGQGSVEKVERALQSVFLDWRDSKALINKVRKIVKVRLFFYEK
jgi:hypothetical protein